MIEQITINAELVMELGSKEEWVARIPKHLSPAKRAGEKLIWVDKFGNVFELGRDFSAAEKLMSYPCRIYRPVCVDDALNNKTTKP